MSATWSKTASDKSWHESDGDPGRHARRCTCQRHGVRRQVTRVGTSRITGFVEMEIAMKRAIPFHIIITLFCVIVMSLFYLY